jgi:hypothetical protein
MAREEVRWPGWPVVVHSARTAVAALASVLAARLFRLPETYWAAITTLVITQSSLGAALTVSWQRFVGTALGAIVGALVAAYFGTSTLVFGTCVFILGLVCAAARADRSAYRFGGITLAIVLGGAGRSCVANRLSSLCRSVDWDRRGLDLGLDLAGEGRLSLGERADSPLRGSGKSQPGASVSGSSASHCW